MSDSFIEYSKNYIYFMNGIIKTLIPLSFTIFIFAYREQKEVAYSLFKRKRSKKLIAFIVITFILILLNVLWIFDGKTVEKLSNLQILCLDVISLAWILSAVVAYSTILRNINVLREFKYNIDKIKKGFINIDDAFKNKNEWFKNDHTFARKLQKELKEISVASEICFQILTAKDKYKLSYDFSNSFKMIHKVLIKKIIIINQNSELFSKIVPCSGTRYFDLYVSTLKYMNDLLEIAFKGGKDTEINLIIDNLGKIQPMSFTPNRDFRREWKIYRKHEQYRKPREKVEFSDHENLDALFKDFYDQYYCIICQVILVLYKNNDNRTSRVFHSLLLRERDREYPNENDMLSLITSLFIKALHKNNIKLLTDVTNIFLDLIKISKVPSNSKTHVIGEMEFPIDVIVENVKDYQRIEKKVSHVMFLGIVKSIELGHYQCAGFLIKNLVKTFEFKNVKLVIEESYKDIGNNIPDLQLSKKLTQLLSAKITFSASSYEYCFLKAILLISTQQYYVSSIKKTKVETNMDAFIDLKYFFKDENYKHYGYLKSKIEGLNSLYGLLALESKNLKKFYKENDI